MNASRCAGEMNRSQLVRIGGHDFHIREVAPKDIADVLALHQRVFGDGSSAEWFAWKYGHLQGEGHGVAIGAWCEGELIAHCGGIPRTLHGRDGIRPGLQVGDVMVDPRWRGLLTRRGPFFQVSQALYGHGQEVNGAPRIAFGFPNERHLSLALKLGLVWNGGPMHALHWDCSEGQVPIAPWWRAELVARDSPRLEPTVERAWHRMNAERGTEWVAERSATYFRWRYLERPEQQCDFLLLRRPWARQGTGVVVLKRTDDEMHWIDWIGPRALVSMACREARRTAFDAGCRSMFAWASPAVSSSLSATGFEDRGVVAWLSYSRTSGLSEHDVQGANWWWMGGDTDFL